MPVFNSNTHYGSVTKAFHWLVALLIFTVIPLGIIGNNLADAPKPDIPLIAYIFTFHKTIGVVIFLLALLRILWALLQPKPYPMHSERRLETWAAVCVHWVLYGALVIVPLSGWIGHAAAARGAPILLPFANDLLFVPKQQWIANMFFELHEISSNVLLIALVLHVLGAIKHFVIDRDKTLQRMLPGTVDLSGQGLTASALRVNKTARNSAIGLWLVIVVFGLGLTAVERSQHTHTHTHTH